MQTLVQEGVLEPGRGVLSIDYLVRLLYFWLFL